MSDWQILRGDCFDWLKELPDASVDAIVTDPPYDLTAVSRGGSRRQNDPETPFGRHQLQSVGFMGKAWDGTGIAFRTELWSEILRVAKPGAHLVAFGGTRTYHRMVCAIEDAGWEIRDSIHWLYGQGFPKSLDVSKAIDKQNGATDAASDWSGWGTALKPAHESIVLARKPFPGTVAENVLVHGTGALHIDACRIAGVKDVPASPRRAPQGAAYGELGNDPATGGGWDPAIGRWPPNVLLSHADGCERIGERRISGDGHWPNARPVGGISTAGHKGQAGLAERDAAETVEVWNCASGCPVAELDRQSGVLKSGDGNVRRNPYSGFHGGDGVTGVPEVAYGDSGGASRFFPNFEAEPPFQYVAKANRSEREAGLKADEGARANTHPTVKPVALMRWLCRLVTPPGGVVLDPFAGSGTTGIAAVLEGFDFLGIEREAEYVEIAEARIRHHEGRK